VRKTAHGDEKRDVGTAQLKHRSVLDAPAHQTITRDGPRLGAAVISVVPDNNPLQRTQHGDRSVYRPIEERPVVQKSCQSSKVKGQGHEGQKNKLAATLRLISNVHLLYRKPLVSSQESPQTELHAGNHQNDTLCAVCYFTHGRVAKYCYEVMSMSVCLSSSIPLEPLRAYLWNHTRTLYQFFCVCYLCP